MQRSSRIDAGERLTRQQTWACTRFLCIIQVPRSIRHQVMERLVHATNIVWGQARSHRLDTLTLPGQ